MLVRRIFLVVLLAVTTMDATAVTETDRPRIPVFPGAEGFGALSWGGSARNIGEGPKIIHVSSLNAEGHGSLAAALNQKGPRTVVFDIGGTIRLEKNLRIDHPFITVAGQTAPQPVTITGAGIEVRTNHVLIEHLVIAPGDDPHGSPPDQRDALILLGGVAPESAIHGVYVNHLSLRWGIDENVSVYQHVSDVTLDSCIIAEGLHRSLHSKGVHGYGFHMNPGAGKISLLRSLLAMNDYRNPRLHSGPVLEMTNNVVYGWGTSQFAQLDATPTAKLAAPPKTTLSLVANRFIPGSWSSAGPSVINHPKSSPALVEVFAEGNQGPLGTEQNKSFLRNVTRLTTQPSVFAGAGPAKRVWQGADVETRVLNGAGAWPAYPDGHDSRIRRFVRERGGAIIDATTEVKADRAAKTRRPSRAPLPVQANRILPSGYTALEHWLEQQRAEVEGRDSRLR